MAINFPCAHIGVPKLLQQRARTSQHDGLYCVRKPPSHKRRDTLQVKAVTSTIAFHTSSLSRNLNNGAAAKRRLLGATLIPPLEKTLYNGSDSQLPSRLRILLAVRVLHGNTMFTHIL